MKQMLCLGDSITDADRLFSPDGLGYGYVSRLSRLLHENQKPVSIINRGIDGFTVRRICESLRTNPISQKPDIITLLVGINDVSLMMSTDRTDAQKQQMLCDFEAAYRRLMEELSQYEDCSLLLLEPFIFPRPAAYKNWIPFVKAISETIEALAGEYGCLYLPLHDRLNEMAEREGYAAVTTDGVHLTELSHQFIADTLYEALPL